MARKKNPENVKNLMIRVRVTTQEHEQFIENAKKNGFASVSEYIRSLVAEKPGKNKKKADD